MNRPIIKFIADFGPLLVFFTIYFNNDQNLKVAIPPFIFATLISIVAVFFLEKKIPIVPLTSGILISVFGGLTLYFDNKIFFYMKPTVINLLFAVTLFFGKYFTKKPLLKYLFNNTTYQDGSMSTMFVDRGYNEIALRPSVSYKLKKSSFINVLGSRFSLYDKQIDVIGLLDSYVGIDTKNVIKEEEEETETEEDFDEVF